MEKLLEKIEKYARARSQTHVTLVAFAGGYLLYLAYDMIKPFIDGSVNSSVPLYLFAVLFVVCGVLLCGGGLYALWKGWYKENTPRKGPEESEEDTGKSEADTEDSDSTDML